MTFPDVPEAITQAESPEEARHIGLDALTTAVEFYLDDAEPVPLPSSVSPGEPFVELRPSISAKVLLPNEMLHQRVQPAQLAERLHTSLEEVDRLTNLQHAGSFDGIAAAFNALGKTLELRAA